MNESLHARHINDSYLKLAFSEVFLKSCILVLNKYNDLLNLRKKQRLFVV